MVAAALPKLFDLAVEIHKRGWYRLFGRLKSHLRAGKKMQVLLFGAGYNWDDCREELQSVGIDPLFLRMSDNLEYWASDQSPKVDASALTSAWERLRADDKLREFFIWDHIDFFPVLEERLRFLIERLTPACVNAYEKTAKILKKNKIKAFLASTFPTCIGHSAARAARNSGIPVVTWQIGGYGFANMPAVAYTDLMSSNVFFAFGEGIVNRFAKPARRFGTRIVSIGSPSLEALYQMPRSNKAKKIAGLTIGKKVVLYVSTILFQNTLFVAFSPPLSDNHLWCTQRAILDVLGKHNDYTIVVKTHPGRREPPMHLYAKENKFDNCQFIREEYTFTDLLPIADLVVIDFPTTTIIEAPTTSKPIFVYTGHLHLDAQAQKLLEKRAFCYRELRSFADALDRYLSEYKIDKRVDLNDKEFLTAYGISSHREGSGVRAAKMLKQIISGKRQI